MDVSERPWTPTGVCEHPRAHVDVRGRLWTSVDACGRLWEALAWHNQDPGAAPSTQYGEAVSTVYRINATLVGGAHW